MDSVSIDNILYTELLADLLKIQWTRRTFVLRTSSIKVMNLPLHDGVSLTNSGGDDCCALKGRSSNIFIQNVTCRGGNGMAIGSLGQYLDDSTVENVVVDDVKVCFVVDNLAQGVD